MSTTDYLKWATWALALLAPVAYGSALFFQWELDDLFPFFVHIIVGLPLMILGLLAGILAIVLPFRRWKTAGLASLLPLGLLVAGFLAIQGVDFTALWLKANFRSKLRDREEVVRRIENGELRPNVAHNASLIKLPERLMHTSIGGGEVVVEGDGARIKVLFYTFRGVLDNFSGFVHCPDDVPPKAEDFGGDLFYIERFGDRWYYVGAH